jgi:hypothetical protein
MHCSSTKQGHGDGKPLRRGAAGRLRTRVLSVLLVLVASFSFAGAWQLHAAPPALADGPAPCSAGPPPFPFAGFCATYAGRNTWYGTYGPGFPTAEGWALCAENAATGGFYPAPGYDYVPSGAPPGAGGDWNALGFAFSEAAAFNDWNGQFGQFTADEFAVGAKLIYDSVVWGTPTGSMDPGVQNAYDTLAYWFNQALGTAPAPLQLTTGLVGGGTSFTTSAVDQVHLSFPGTNAPVVGQPLLMTIANGTFNAPGGPTTIGG